MTVLYHGFLFACFAILVLAIAWVLAPPDWWRRRRK